MKFLKRLSKKTKQFLNFENLDIVINNNKFNLEIEIKNAIDYLEIDEKTMKNFMFEYLNLIQQFEINLIQKKNLDYKIYLGLRQLKITTYNLKLETIGNELKILESKIYRILKHDTNQIINNNEILDLLNKISFNILKIYNLKR